MVAGRHNVAVTGLGATMWLWLGDTMWGWISSHQESPGTLSFVLPLCYVSAMLCTVVQFSVMYSCTVQCCTQQCTVQLYSVWIM